MWLRGRFEGHGGGYLWVNLGAVSLPSALPQAQALLDEWHRLDDRGSGVYLLRCVEVGERTAKVGGRWGLAVAGVVLPPLDLPEPEPEFSLAATATQIFGASSDVWTAGLTATVLGGSSYQWDYRLNGGPWITVPTGTPFEAVDLAFDTTYIVEAIDTDRALIAEPLLTTVRTVEAPTPEPIIPAPQSVSVALLDEGPVNLPNSGIGGLERVLRLVVGVSIADPGPGGYFPYVIEVTVGSDGGDLTTYGGGPAVVDGQLVGVVGPQESGGRTLEWVTYIREVDRDKSLLVCATAYAQTVSTDPPVFEYGPSECHTVTGTPVNRPKRAAVTVRWGLGGVVIEVSAGVTPGLAEGTDGPFFPGSEVKIPIPYDGKPSVDVKFGGITLNYGAGQRPKWGFDWKDFAKNLRDAGGVNWP